MAGTQGSDLLVEKVLAWLDQHYSEPVSVSELARQFCVSDRTLSRRFGRVMGVGLASYRQALRMRTSAYLLRTTRMTISDIAWRVGYADVSAFTRRFRQYLGDSPGQYRVQQLASQSERERSA